MPESSQGRILIVEDEAQIRKFLRISLQAHRYDIDEARLGEDGLELCANASPDLVVLDLGLPDMDGFVFIRRLREWSEVPVLVLSVRDTEQEKVAALDLGANDYVTKPFGISELMARIRALLRNRSDSPSATVFEEKGLRMDLYTREVTLNGTPMNLAPKEYELLRLFLTHPGRVLTHSHILGEIWGPGQIDETHYLRVLVRQLRLKLGDDPTAPRYIETVQGVGYRLASGD